MEWTTERQKLDNELWQQVVKKKDLTAVYRRFATHKEMVEFSNEQYPYPYRRNSILAMLVQSEDLDLIKRFWKHYFDKNNEEVKDAELEFLHGTNQIGQYMNYHYFRDAAPEEVLRQEADFWGKEYEPQPRPENAERRWVIYEFLKARRLKLAQERNLTMEVPSYNVEYDKEQDSLTDEVMLDSFAVWRSKSNMFGELVLVNKGYKFGEQVSVELDSSVPLTQQVFKQLDWADEFFWAGKVLPQWEKRLKNLDPLERKMSMYFTKSHGMMVLNEEKSVSNGNLKDNVPGAAYMNASYPEMLLIGVNCKYFPLQNSHLMKVVLPHELAHGVDLKCKEGKKPFSDTDFMKMVGMWMFVTEQRLLSFVKYSYNDDKWLSELTAAIMEETDHAEPLLNKVRQVFGRYTQMALENNVKGMKVFDEAVQNKLGNKYDLWRKAYVRMEKCMEIQYKDNEPFGDFMSPEWEKHYRAFYRSFLEFGRSDAKFEKMIDGVANDILSEPKNKPEKSADMLKLWCKKIAKGIYGR